MQFAEGKALANVRQASTEELLDRATVFRDGAEPKALELIEAELNGRGVRSNDLAAHFEAARLLGAQETGGARSCERCFRPAVWRGWAWHRLWGLLPIFPRRQALCEQHRLSGAIASRPPAGVNPD